MLNPSMSQLEDLSSFINHKTCLCNLDSRDFKSTVCLSYSDLTLPTINYKLVTLFSLCELPLTHLKTLEPVEWMYWMSF